MFRTKCALLCVLFALSIVNPILGRKSFGRGHSYPSSRGGLSGSGSHSYPRSPGLSGSGSHGYPSSGGMSGSHGYPSSGGSHGYPASGGLSGTGSANTHHTNSHGYPPSSGLSGNARPAGQTTINNHYHYTYNPPNKIQYTPAHGGAPISYPVYRGSPPNYVYQYKDSGSKYSSLLAGLALLNLGALAGTAYSHYGHTYYKPKPGEVCKFGIKKENSDYEETKIDCQLLTSFIYEAETKGNNPTNTTVVTTSITNVTVVNTTNAVPEPISTIMPDVTTNFTVLPNGTMVPVVGHDPAMSVNLTSADEANKLAADGAIAAANNLTSSVTVTTTTTNTTLVNAVDVKGPPVAVTPGMKCYVIRNSPSSNMRKSVPCGLLQTYATSSLTGSATRHMPLLAVLAAALSVIVAY